MGHHRSAALLIVIAVAIAVTGCKRNLPTEESAAIGVDVVASDPTLGTVATFSFTQDRSTAVSLTIRNSSSRSESFDYQIVYMFGGANSWSVGGSVTALPPGGTTSPNTVVSASGPISLTALSVTLANLR